MSADHALDILQRDPAIHDAPVMLEILDVDDMAVIMDGLDINEGGADDNMNEEYAEDNNDDDAFL